MGGWFPCGSRAGEGEGEGAAAQSPTNSPLPPDWTLLGVGSQSPHHGGTGLWGKLCGALRVRPSSGECVFELSCWTLQPR